MSARCLTICLSMCLERHLQVLRNFQGTSQGTYKATRHLPTQFQGNSKVAPNVLQMHLPLHHQGTTKVPPRSLKDTFQGTNQGASKGPPKIVTSKAHTKVPARTYKGPTNALQMHLPMHHQGTWHHQGTCKAPNKALQGTSKESARHT